MERAQRHMEAVRASWVENCAEHFPLDDLRAALFIEARALHHCGYLADGQTKHHEGL